MSDNNTTDKQAHADTIIRNHVIWSMGAGLIPVLIADIFAVSALQLDMIRQLCRNYDIQFQETQGKALVTSLTSSTLARVGARSLVKLIPGIGSLLGGVTVSVFAGASTYALGEVFKKHFESGGTILDFDPDRLRKYYKEKFEKGKSVVKDMTKEEAGLKRSTDKSTADGNDEATDVKVEEQKDLVEKLKDLADLREKGAITETEFKALKKRIISESS